MTCLVLPACGDSPEEAGSTSEETGATDSSGASQEAGSGADSTSSSGSTSDSGDPTTDSTGSTSGDDTTTTTDSGGDGDGTGETGEPVDCDNLPSLPVSYTVRSGPRGSEDFVFGTNGQLINIVDGGNLFHSPHVGQPMLAVPGVGSGDASGTSALSNGDVVFADSGAGRVVKVDGAGNTSTLASAIAYPNGLTVDMDDNVYVSEHDGGRVLRINPDTLDVTTVADGLWNPNGLHFDADYENLYIGSFGGGTVHRLNIASGQLTEYANNLGSGGLDGLVLDACGNVYVTDFGPGIVWRIDPQGQVELAVDLSADASWIPNMHFGSGHGGWDPDILYVINRGADEVYEVDLGVGGIELPHL